MVRLGDMIDVRYGTSITKFWLVKRPSLKQFTNKIYVVLGLIPGKGWMAVTNDTLKEARQFMEKYAV